MASFVGVSRPGHALTVPESVHGVVSLLEIPALAISSTDIRARVASDKPIWYLLPDGVVQYIAKHDLYRGGK
jgi:nicotinate-nucleotide adenylyltransferase